jgi:hypothetical protein
MFQRLRAADSLGLVDRNGVAEGRSFHRRWREFLFATFGAIGLRDDLGYGVSRGDDAIERGDSERGRAEEDQAHGDTNPTGDKIASATNPTGDKIAGATNPVIPIRRPSAFF